jgi:uncharacterized integral membrane protein (TIGR02327 family)
MPLLNIAAALFFIIVAWWALQALKFEKLVRNPRSPQAKVLQIILSIALGSLIATFFTDYLTWFTLLQQSLLSP